MLLILFYLAPFHKNIGHFGGLQSGSSSLIGDMPAWYPGSEPYSTCGASLENLKVPALFPLANGTINFAAFCHFLWRRSKCVPTSTGQASRLKKDPLPFAESFKILRDSPVAASSASFSLPPNPSGQL